MRLLPQTRTLTRPAGPPLAPATFLAICEIKSVRSGGWDRHRHAEHEVIIAGAGTYRTTVNDEPASLQPGEALVVRPGDWHEDMLGPGTRYDALWFRLPGGLLADGVTVGERISRPGVALAPTIRQLATLAGTGAPPARIDAMLAAVIGLIIDGLPATALAPAFATDHGFAARLQAQFARIPVGRTSAEAIARATGLSRRSLERRCRDELGCGPVRAYAQWRIQRAGELLRTTDWPVRAISETLGFANPFHFSRAFARVHGAPPAQWRIEAVGGNG